MMLSLRSMTHMTITAMMLRCANSDNHGKYDKYANHAKPICSPLRAAYESDNGTRNNNGNMAFSRCADELERGCTTPQVSPRKPIAYFGRGRQQPPLTNGNEKRHKNNGKDTDERRPHWQRKQHFPDRAR